VYSHSITVLFNLGHNGSLDPEIKNFMWYLPARYILLFFHKEWLGSGECSESTTWFWTCPSVFAKSLMLPKSWDPLLQSCTQAGPLFTAYIPPLTSLAHGLRLPLSNLVYWAFFPTFQLRTE
jgi:hypothetical protein